MTYPEKYAHFLPKISKKMREKFITALGNFPLSQTPRKRRDKSNGDRNSTSEEGVRATMSVKPPAVDAASYAV